MFGIFAWNQMNEPVITIVDFCSLQLGCTAAATRIRARLHFDWQITTIKYYWHHIPNETCVIKLTGRVFFFFFQVQSESESEKLTRLWSVRCSWRGGAEPSAWILKTRSVVWCIGGNSCLPPSLPPSLARSLCCRVACTKRALYKLCTAI